MTLSSCSNTVVPQTEGNRQVLVDYEFGSRDLLDVYNVGQVKARLSSPAMFIVNVRAASFTLEVMNKEPENMVITVYVGSDAMDKLPQHLEYFGRTVPVNHRHGPSIVVYDLCLTREESIQAEKKFSIFVGNRLSRIVRSTAVNVALAMLVQRE